MLVALRPGNKVPFDPVIVVPDPAEITRVLKEQGIVHEAVFVASRQAAGRARGDLDRYLTAAIKSEKRESRRARLRQIRRIQQTYLWHCGGFVRAEAHFLFCSLVRDESYRADLRQPRFPGIADGGTDVCRGIFSVVADRMVELDWNPET